MLQTKVSNPSLSRRVVASAETRVVFPAPWTPLRPMKKGLVVVLGWEESCERMKGIQWGDLSSMIFGLLPGGEAVGALAEDIEAILRK